MSKTYVACQIVIEKGRYGTVDEMMYKLDIFLLNDRITQGEYEELIALLTAVA